MAGEKKYLTVKDGSRIYYEKYGQGFPVFLLHGNLGNGRFFSEQIPALAEHFQLFVVDTRGHGHSVSRRRQLTFQLLAEDLKEVMTAEKINKADIIGFSDGANIAMVFAAAYPKMVHRLVLNAGNTEFSGLRKIYQIRSWLMVWFFRIFSGLHARMKNASVAADLLTHDTGLATADLKKISPLTLVIVGKNDIIKAEHSRYLAETIPNAQLVVVEAQGHFLARKAPERFNREILDFLTSKNK